MKIHRITYGKNDESCQMFAGSEAEASKLATALKKDATTQGKPERAPVDIPTDKVGLIEWLNKNAVLVKE